jgi:HemY protein
MRYLLALLLVLVVAVSVVPLLMQDPGSVIITYADVSIETTLTFLIIAIILSLIVLSIIYRVIKLALGFPDFMFRRGQQRFMERSQKNFYLGLTELARGHWKRAEKLLVSSFEGSGDHLLAYLGAARAAQYQGEHERRDQYLKRAHGLSAEAELATGLTQAELQIRQGQNERALATLSRLSQAYHDNPYLLELLLQLYLQLGEWERLRDHLPNFIKANVIDVERASALEVEAALQILRNNARQGGIERVLTDWDALAYKLKENVALVTECASQLLALQAHDQAEKILKKAIEHHWNNELVKLYGQVKSQDAQAQLAFAESWTEDHAQDASVQLALARICLHNQLLGKARFHLEASVEMGADADTYYELASLLEQLNDHHAAQHCYQEGLTRAVKHE